MKPPSPSSPAAQASAGFTEALELVLRDPLSLEEHDDLARFVPEIPPQSFFQLAQALHDEGRLEFLFPHADPAQLTTVIDLGGWQGDRLDVVRVREWIAAIVDTYEAASAPRGALARLVTAMDPELWTFALLPGTAIMELDPEDDQARDEARAAVADLYTYDTPDGFFVVAVPDDPIGRTAIQIVDAIYRDDLSLGRELVVAVRAGLYSVIEEELLRWRQGRLADLGFVPWEEAMALLRPLTPAQALALTPRPRPGLGARQGDPAPLPPEAALLRRVLGRVDPGEAGLRTREFLLLVNEVIAAQRLPPGDPAAAQRALHQTRGIVELGLELLATQRPQGIELDAFLAEQVVRIGLRAIFRVGYGALDRLRSAALSLHRGGQISLTAIGSLLDRPWGPMVRALAQQLPELPLEETSAKTRAFASLRDVAKATRRLAEATLLAGLAFAPEGLAIDPVWVHRIDEPERLTLGDLIRSALIYRRIPGVQGDFAPLRAADLEWAAAHVLGPEGALEPSLHRELATAATTLGAEPAVAEAVLEPLLLRLRVELAGLERDPRDPGGQPDLVRVGGLVTVQRVGVWLRTGLSQEV